MKQKLRIGLLLNTYETSAWAYEMIQKLINEDFCTFSLVIFNKSDELKENYAISNLLNDKILNLYNKYDRHFFKDKDEDAFERKNLNKIIKTDEIFVLSRGSEKLEFKNSDINKINSYKLDVIIKLGFKNLSGNILNTAKYGVWTIIPEDSTMNVLSYPGFSEVTGYKDQSLISIQRINENSYDNDILFVGSTLTDRLSVERNNNKNFWRASISLPRELKNLWHLGGEKYFKIKAIKLTDLEKQASKPSVNKTLFGVLKLQGIRLKNIFRSLFFSEQWILLFNLKNYNNFNFDVNSFIKILPPKDRIWADPFIIKKNDWFYIFIEEMTKKNGKGHISVMKMDNEGNYSKPTKIIEEDYHMSYPFIIEEDNQIYMIPEANKSKGIRLYKCIDFPYQWKFEKCLIKDVIAADTTVKYMNGKYWLFTTMVNKKECSLNDELFLYYSDSLLSDNWMPHPLNPIVTSVKRARPAGKIFEFENEIYRPSQNCSKRYGYGLILNKIITINENDYEEEQVDFIKPSHNRVLGIHTFNSINGLTFIDALYLRHKHFF